MGSARRAFLCRDVVALLALLALVTCAGVAPPAAAEATARPLPAASAQTLPLIEPAPPGVPSGPAVSREVVAWRTETSRTIEVPGRGYRTEISTAPIHYRDSAGRWQPLESRATTNAVVPIGSDKITDCHIVDGVYANSSFCNNDHLEIGYPSTAAHDVHRRVLLKFDLAAIPQTAVVVEADVRLTTITVDRSTIDFPVQALRLAQSWTTSATWNNSGTGSWSGGRWGPTLLDSRRLTATLGAWHIFPTVQVQNWVDRSAANNGLILKPQNESTGVGVIRFASSTNADPAKRPLMSVDWRIQGGQKEVNTFVRQSLTASMAYHANRPAPSRPVGRMPVGPLKMTEETVGRTSRCRAALAPLALPAPTRRGRARRTGGRGVPAVAAERGRLSAPSGSAAPAPRRAG